MIEKIKLIPGFNSQFAATCNGKIYDIKNNRFLPLKIHDGRYEVRLPGFKRAYRVHKLIALAYHGYPPFENGDIHHDDTNALNNTPQNLVYLTHSVHMELHARYHGKAKKMSEAAIEACSKKVAQYDLDDNLIATYPSAHEAARQTGIAQSSISRCCLGIYKSAGECKWKNITSQQTL